NGTATAAGQGRTHRPGVFQYRCTVPTFKSSPDEAKSLLALLARSKPQLSQRHHNFRRNEICRLSKLLSRRYSIAHFSGERFSVKELRSRLVSTPIVTN